MYTLMQKRPILHALVWIALYIATVILGDELSAATNFAYVTPVLVIGLSGLLVVYLDGYSL